MIKRNKPAQLALVITNRLFGEAPLHLKKPQTAELARLTAKQLLVIDKIKRFPIPKKIRAEIVAELGSDALVIRMEKRARIAGVVLQAEKEGFYEAAEHATGMLSPGVSNPS